jgi:hypothetical protein
MPWFNLGLVVSTSDDTYTTGVSEQSLTPMVYTL